MTCTVAQTEFMVTEELVRDFLVKALANEQAMHYSRKHDLTFEMWLRSGEVYKNRELYWQIREDIRTDPICGSLSKSATPEQILSDVQRSVLAEIDHKQKELDDLKSLVDFG